MSSRQRKRPGRPSHATVIAYLALFVALTGTAWAAATIGPRDIKDDAVRSRHIKDGNVKTGDLQGNSVTGGKIADQTVASADVLNQTLTQDDLGSDSVASDEVAQNSLNAEDLAQNSVTSDEVAPDELTSSDLAPTSVGGSELAPNSVRASEIGDGIVARLGTPVPIDGGTAENGAYSVDHANASCNAGEELVGGMSQWSGADNEALDLELWIAEIQPNFAAESVTVTGGNDSGATRSLTAIAICLQT